MILKKFPMHKWKKKFLKPIKYFENYPSKLEYCALIIKAWTLLVENVLEKFGIHSQLPPINLSIEH